MRGQKMNSEFFRLGLRISLVSLLFAILAGCQALRQTPETAFSDCDGCPTMKIVQGGRFLIGSDEGEEGRPEGPIHEVRIDYDFAVGMYEVTFSQYNAFVEDTGHESEKKCTVWSNDEWVPLDDTSWRNPGYGRQPLENEAVGCVSWRDAKAYVQWLRNKTGKPYRLLSEAEWEYVARAGATTRYFWGDGTEDMCKYANVYDKVGRQASDFPWEPVDCDDGHGHAAPVGSYEPNPFGLYDVIGNVWEWTEDCHTEYYPLQPVDGSSHQDDGECWRRSIRGGSWITRASRQRAAFRGRDPEDTVFVPFGFRVARDL